MKKRMLAVLVTACMLFGTVQSDITVRAEEAEQLNDIVVATEGPTEENPEETKAASEFESRSEEEAIQAMQHPTGLIPPEIIDVGEISESEVFELTDELQEDMLGSYVYTSEWDKCSTNYFYNQLTEEEKRLWDELDAMCLRLLCTTENAEPDAFGNRTKYVSCGNVDLDTAKDLIVIFRYSNPQYYFLNSSYRNSHDSLGNCFVGFGVYSAFTDGTARQTATQAVKSQFDAWSSIANTYPTEAEKVKALHDLIVNKVDYNYDIFNSDFSEDTSYTQSAYSVFCMDKTVCAGYSQAFEMMCNAVGVDCIAVTSSDHGWNKVRINDSWYNVDCTWADQTGSISYKYFERNDAYYDSDSIAYATSHTERDYWVKYLPTCSLDSNATYSNPGTLPVISQTTAQPEIRVTKSGSSYRVTLSSQTPNALLYYTINGGTPTPAYTKSMKYAGSFMVDSACTVKAVAVCDTYWDSNIASAEVSSAATEETPEEKPTYRISFSRNGATSGTVGDITYTSGQNVMMPQSSFVRNGYEFTGWNTRADGTGESYAAGQSVATGSWTGNVTLYAQWKAGTDSSNKACFVALLYENVLERNAADSEIRYWINELENGRTGAEVAYLFIFSQEFKNKGLNDADYVERLYMSLMGRASDSGGKSDWITHLRNGVSREYVLKQFIESTEFTNKCKSYGIIRGTISLTEARDQNYNVTRFVARNYTQFLGRDYEVDGLNYWCNIILKKERTMQEVAFGFVFSTECKNKNLSNKEFAEMMYRGCFDREGEADGVAYWTNYLNTGEKSRDDVFYGFANSREFENMVHSYGL